MKGISPFLETDFSLIMRPLRNFLAPLSGDSWMYPYQPPMGNPYRSPIARGYLWVSYPQESVGVPQSIPWVHC